MVVRCQAIAALLWVSFLSCSLTAVDSLDALGCPECEVPNGTARCNENGSCELSCQTHFANCDRVVRNGCEVNLQTSNENCGSCGYACGAPNATQQCSGGECVVVGCAPGYRECNGNKGDGCEVELSKDPLNCGTCGFSCQGKECKGGVCLEVEAVYTSASAFHACALLTSGEARCWGDNLFGQLGNGKSCGSSTCVEMAAVDVTGIANVKAMALGRVHTCAIDARGDVYCWGYNVAGQLGNGKVEATSVRSPVKVEGISQAIAIVAGEQHTCALLSSAKVFCWGAAGYGQTGVEGAAQAVLVPAQVAPDLHAFRGAVGIAAGANTTCAHSWSGESWCWGDDRAGQLGSGATSSDPCAGSAPYDCAASPTPVVGADFVQVAVGTDFSCFLLRDGSIACAGDGSSGKLGNGGEASSPTPQPVLGLNGLAWKIRAGSAHACALQRGSNTLWCWGSNLHGQLLDVPSTSPKLTHATLTAVSFEEVSDVALGADFTCLLAKGSVYCAGDNSSGQLGYGAAPDTQPHPVANKVNGLP